MSEIDFDAIEQAAVLARQHGLARIRIQTAGSVVELELNYGPMQPTNEPFKPLPKQVEPLFKRPSFVAKVEPGKVNVDG